MTQFIGFGMIGWAVGAYLLLVVISHIAWWSRRRYFPSFDLCADAHDRFHLSQKDKEELKEEPDKLAEAKDRFWHAIAAKLISNVPEEMEVSGFFATLAWFPIVLLNVLLLAQVVGTLVGEGGGQWEVYPFGTYGAIPLLTAVLYAFSQTACGVIYGESREKKRYLFFAFLAVAIAAEGGLAVYRAWLIRGGGTSPGANVVDNSLAGQFGIAIGAFFGIFFPLTHAALGYVGYPKFVVPLVRYSLRISGGVLMLFWSAVNYFLLAWHPTHPKDWVKPSIVVIPPEELARAEEQKRLLANATTLSGDLKLLLEDLPATPASVDQLLQAANGLRERWIAITQDANQILADATRVASASATALVGTGESHPPRLTPLYQLAASHDRLVKAIEHIRKGEIELDQYGKPKGEAILKRMETCRADLAKLQRRLEAIQAIGCQGTDAHGLLGGCTTSLGNLTKAFNAIPEAPPGHFRYPDYQKLRDLVSHCQAAHARLTQRWTTAKPAIPSADELKARRDELDALTNLTQAYTDASKSLYEAKQMAEARLKRVEGRPRWFYWLADRIA